MLVRVGSCEAEVKVACCLSMPRLTFSDNFFCISQALAPHGISPIKYTGAFWGQTLQNVFEEVVDTHDVILTVDYDSVFSARTVEALLTLLMYSGYDAIAPLQVKRESNAVMFALPGVKPEDRTVVEDTWFDKPVQHVETAHFGCTFIRTAALKKVPKPWFIAHANEKGDYRGGHCDEDIHFWRMFSGAGNKVGISTNISIGHCELMVTWPSRTVPGGKIQQYPTDFWNKGAADGVWGFIGEPSRKSA